MLNYVIDFKKLALSKFIFRSEKQISFSGLPKKYDYKVKLAYKFQKTTN